MLKKLQLLADQAYESWLNPSQTVVTSRYRSGLRLARINL